MMTIKKIEKHAKELLKKYYYEIMYGDNKQIDPKGFKGLNKKEKNYER